MTSDPTPTRVARVHRRMGLPRSLALAAVLSLALLAPAPADTLAGSALAQPTLTLTPEQATNDVATQHTVVAHLEQNGQPIQGQTIRFRVSGANTATGQAQTDAQGNASFTYQGNNAGDDTILGFADVNPPNGQQDPGEPSDTAGKTWHETTPAPTPAPHVKKDPRKDDWPKLTAEEMKSVQDLIDGGKNAEALAKLVEIMKKYCCNFDQMAGGAPEYDPDPKVSGQTERRKGGWVRIGPKAFSSAAWLYSVLKHEMVHSAQWQDEDAAREMGSDGREIEAYQRQLDQAENTGISDKDKKRLEEVIEILKEG